MTILPNVRAGDSTDAAPPAAPVKHASGVTLIDERNASVVDRQRRRIKVKKLSALDRMKLFRAVGAEDSENRQFMHYAVLGASGTELTGDPVMFRPTALQHS